MKNLEFLEDLIKIIVPAAIVLYAMYLVVKSFLQKDFERRLVELKLKSTETITPIRLSAYERMALLLERISPGNLIIRLNQPNIPAIQFQQLLVSQVREEFNHNLAQQVYISDQSWKLIKASKDNIIGIINSAGKGLPEEAKGVDLAKKVFDVLAQDNEDPTDQALAHLKVEIQKLF